MYEDLPLYILQNECHQKHRHLAKMWLLPREMRFMIFIQSRLHCPGFQSRRRYGVDTGAHRDHTVATPACTALNRDTPCWTGIHITIESLCYIKKALLVLKKRFKYLMKLNKFPLLLFFLIIKKNKVTFLLYKKKIWNPLELVKICN